MNLTFDYVLTQQKTSHEMLTMIARAGRASYTWQSGKLGVVWDAANQPYVAIVGPMNIKAGTFEVSYADATIDEVIGTFVNPARNWEADEVRVRVPGAPTLNSPQTFELEGTTSPELAAREINLIAASQLFHRRRVTWEMDIEGMICTRGDVVRASHDLTVWGYSGRLTGGSRANMTLSLDGTVPISAIGAYMLLRSPFNDFALVGVSGPFGDTSNLNILSGLPASFPMPDTYPDISPADWAWQFDPIETPGRRLKIVSVQPTADEGVRFEAVDDDPNYYNSEFNPYAYTPPRDGALLNGIVFGITFAEDLMNPQTDQIQVRVNWSISASVRVNVDYTINGQTFPSINTTDRSIALNAHSGDNVVVKVTPMSVVGPGAPRIAGYDVTGVFFPLPAVTGFTSVYRDDLTVLKWSPVTDPRSPIYEVRQGASWQDSHTILVTSSVEMLAVGNGRYFVAARFDAANGRIIYGPADSLQVEGATLIRNVLVTKAEHPDWTGDLGGAEAVPVVATDPARFGGGDGSRTAFNLPLTTVDGEPVIYREDWQGRQLLYRTARTNIQRQSTTIGALGWQLARVTATLNDRVGASGLNSMTRITQSISPGPGYLFVNVNYRPTVAPNTEYALWIDLAKGNSTSPNIGAIDASQATVASARINWASDTPTLFAVSNILSYEIVPLANGVFRFRFNVNSGSAASLSPIVYPDNFQALGATVFVDRPQTELAPGGSYIPTAVSAVTITDYTRSGAAITTAIAPASGASMLWTGAGSRMQGGAAIIDNKLTLRGTGDILAADNVFAMDDVLWYGGVSGRGTYETNDENIIDIGYPAPVRVDFDIDAYALNFGENVLSVEDIFAEDDILNASNMQFYSIQPQIRSAQVAGAWSEWADYVPGLINARFFDVRMVLETRNPLIVPFVESFTWTIDVPDLIQRGEIITVAAAGARFTYPKPFHATPNVQITWLDAVNGDRYVLTGQDATGFNIRFFNGSTPVSRQMNYISQGY